MNLFNQTNQNNNLTKQTNQTQGLKKRVFSNDETLKSYTAIPKPVVKKPTIKPSNVSQTPTIKRGESDIERARLINDRANEILASEGDQNSSKFLRNSLKVMFLGGVGEIGKNMTALQFGNDIIIIDCGLAFPGEDMPGVDLVIPDFTFIKENANKIKGIVITHGHEDHIGALPYLLKDVKVPIFGSKLTLTLIENKLMEHKISGVKLNVVKPRNVVKLGCFSVEFIKVNHSIAGAMALSITTPAGVVFHTGDFKIDLEPIDGEVIDLPRISEIGANGVLLLMAESTNVERPGYTLSESTVGQKLEKIFLDNKDRRIFVATFASNIYRVQQICDLAVKYNRKVAVVGRSMINNIDAGIKIGEFKCDRSLFVDVDKVPNIEDKNILILCTGSQGEPASALSRLANGEFNKLVIGENDTVIFSSNPIPGNENMVNNVINNLYRKGAIVIHEDVHTSGHACQEELKIIHTLIKPQYFMPVHGEYRHLKEHSNLAEKIGVERHNIVIPEIGMEVSLNKKVMKITGKVPAGELLVDGLGIGNTDSVVLKDRKLLSQDGLCVAVIAVSGQTGELISEPYLITRGLIYNQEAEVLVEEAKQVLIETLKTIDMTADLDWNEVRNTIRRPLRNYFYKKTLRDPMILPIIYRV